MIFRLDRFFFDEKDIFTFFLGIFVVAAIVFDFPIEPFGQDSLILLIVFMYIARTLVSSIRYEGFMYLTFLGLLFSLFLSPYGLAIYLFLAMVIYTKIQKV